MNWLKEKMHEMSYMFCELFAFAAVMAFVFTAIFVVASEFALFMGVKP